jgi:hypothetical protein
MKLDVGHALYTVGMILLAFITALVITKTLSKYFNKEEPEEK